MDRGAWWAAAHGVEKSWTRLSDYTFTFHFHALEKEMATHSSVLAWRISGTGEPGGLPSMGSHRVEHDWSDSSSSSSLLIRSAPIPSLFSGHISPENGLWTRFLRGWLVCAYLWSYVCRQKEGSGAQRLRTAPTLAFSKFIKENALGSFLVPGQSAWDTFVYHRNTLSSKMQQSALESLSLRRNLGNCPKLDATEDLNYLKLVNLGSLSVLSFHM